MSRRVLLTVGGLTLLGGCSATPVQRLTSTAQTRPLPTRSAGHPGTVGDPKGSEPGRWSLTGRPEGSGAQGSGAQGSGGQGSGGQGSGGQGSGGQGSGGQGSGGQGSGGQGSGGAGGGTKGERPANGEPLYHLDGGSKAIALTIDDGPNTVYTPQVLRLLAKYKVTATFSMIGIQAAAEPGVARDVALAGHVISNHTWRHLDLVWLPPSAVIDEMDRATGAIQRATGQTPAIFRAPYGAWSPMVLRHCQRTGMMPLAWSVDPRDWSRPGVSAIVGNILRNTRTGSIILEHDGGGDRSETVAALGIVIPSLLDAGYHFVTP
jgi:peptidoglycan/xylan/chitin deacetylase (PgdA/CDA1 family)